MSAPLHQFYQLSYPKTQFTLFYFGKTSYLTLEVDPGPFNTLFTEPIAANDPSHPLNHFSQFTQFTSLVT